MLLNKATLGLAKLTSKEESRYSLQSIAVEKDCATVTNEHYLVTVAHPMRAAEKIEDSFPQTEGLIHREIATGETVLVKADAALAALKSLPKKSHIPILQNAAMSADGKLVVNHLSSVSSFDHKAEGKFPDWRVVMPHAEVAFEISIDARYMKLLAEYFIAHGDERLPAVRITCYADDKPFNPRPVRFDGRTADGQDITAVLMPLRTEDSQFPMRPDQIEKKEKEEREAREAKEKEQAEKEQVASE